MVLGSLATIIGTGIGVPVLSSFMEGGLVDILTGKATTEQKIRIARNITIGAVAGICVATIGLVLSQQTQEGQGLARRRAYRGEMGYCSPQSMSILPRYRRTAIF